MLEQKTLLTIELELKADTASRLHLSLNDELLGGTVKNLNWEGSLFEDNQWWDSLFKSEHLEFLIARNADERMRAVIAEALQALVDEITQEEALPKDEDIPY